LSQAEHDIMASSIFITTSYKLAENVAKKVDERLKSLSRKTIAEKSIDENGAIFITDSIEDAIALSNRIAPEHLELMLDNPMEYLPLVKNAGSVFLGKYTPEPVGDYFGGPNHVLPTNGTARFASPLSVDSFIKKSSFICYDKKTFMKNAGDIIRFANAEGLTAHAAAVEARLKDE
jgi:histidinol dehydrogenase